MMFYNIGYTEEDHIRVSELTESDLSFCGQQNIASLEVTVDHKVLVKKVKRLTHLMTNTSYLWLSQWLLQFLHDTVDSSTATEFYVHLSHNNRHDTVDSSADTELYVRYICHTTTDMINTELYVHLSHDNRHDTVDSSADTELYVHLPHDNHKMQMLEIYLLR